MYPFFIRTLIYSRRKKVLAKCVNGCVEKFEHSAVLPQGTTRQREETLRQIAQKCMEHIDRDSV